MATKRTKQTRASSVLGAGIRDAQKEMEKVLRDFRKRLDRMLPEASRKGLVRFEARVEKVQKDFEKARQRAVKEVESRTRRVLDDMGQRAADAVKPLVANLNIASKSDVDRLRKRIHDLELRVHKASTHAEHAA